MHLFYYQQNLLKREEMEESERKKKQEAEKVEESFEKLNFTKADREDPLGSLKCEVEGHVLNIPTPIYPPIRVHDTSWARLIYSEDLLRFHQDQFATIFTDENQENQEYSKRELKSFRQRALQELESVQSQIDDLKRIAECTDSTDLLIIKQKWADQNDASASSYSED